MLKKKFKNIRTKIYSLEEDVDDFGIQNLNEESDTFKVIRSSASRKFLQTKSKKLVIDQLDQSSESSEISGIPDENTIKAAKRRREELRQRQSYPDYIPLEDYEDVEDVMEKQLESRLVREDEEDAEDELGPYAEEKLPLGKKAEKEHKRLRKVGIEESIMDVDFEDEDDEFIQWEMDAIKKGGGIFSNKPSKPPIKRPIGPNLTQKDIETNQTSSEKLEIDLQVTKNRYTYFQELRLFIENLVGFLDDKVVTIEITELEKLENDFQKLLTDRSEFIMKKILKEDSDDLKSFCNVYQDKTSNNMNNVNDNIQEEKDEVDEFDKISYHRTRLFDDVVDEFKSLDSVKSIFDIWKRDFNEDYTKAYGDLSLPSVFEFYVRHEILLWESFEGHTNFEEIKWFQVLCDSGETTDNIILKKVIDKVVLPRTKYLIMVLDPYSNNKIKSTIEFFDSITKFVDKESQNFKDFSSAITSRLQNVVSSIEVPEDEALILSLTHTSPQREITEVEIERSRDRYFWRKYELLQNLILWRNYLSDDFLQPLVTEHLIYRCLLRVLDLSPPSPHKFEQMLRIIPSEWLSASILERMARGAAGVEYDFIGVKGYPGKNKMRYFVN
ncbi:6369_t:CDS:10 [Diversispora eburnea]|uniref:6369_t:CDS:1 n=1 Tax=Diversispora eburnea TaxID=1213867 RepID=A0A9N8Z9N6_9GLOM|nr:6369_t:CDS:10 [Diversispora eburnea]